MKRIEDIDKTTPDLPLHRAQLRRSLLASKQFEGSNLSNMTKLLPVGLVLVLLIMFNAVQKPESTIVDFAITVNAQEVLGNVVEEFQSLSPDEIQALNEKLGVDLATILTEARAAEDLHIVDVVVTEENGETSYTMNYPDAESNGGGTTFAIIDEDTWDELTFLEYSRADGTTVQLGVNPLDNYFPVVIFVVSPDAMEMTINGGYTQSSVDSVSVMDKE